MLLDDSVVFAVNIATITLLCFNAILLVPKGEQNLGFLTLSVSFVCITLVICQPTLKQLFPNLQMPVLIMALPALLLIAPCFWFYIKALTCEQKLNFSKNDIPHFVLPIIGLAVATFTFLLPSYITHSLLVEGDDKLIASLPFWFRNSIYFALIITFGLVLAWLAQSAFYLVKTIRRLVEYRARLKDIFSTTEQKEIRWLSGLVILIGVPWSIVALNIFLDNLFISTSQLKLMSHISTLVAVLFMSFWALRQQPGFAEIHNIAENDHVKEITFRTPEKYKTSALNAEIKQKIAVKINHAFESEQLFLDANLSLPKLAKHIATSPNYISQTLSETLNTNFFDYVNRYRVTYAKDALVHSKKSVIDIAMSAGFNSKSAFYTAFKKQVGQTPSKFRHEHNATYIL